MVTKIKLVLYDLDGTLVDSAPDLADSINYLLSNDKLKTHSVVKVRTMIGHNIKKLVEFAYAASGRPLSKEEHSKKVDAMMQQYQKNLTNKTLLREGAVESIEYAFHNDIRTAVVTNKPINLAKQVLENLSLASKIDVVIGGEMGFPAKPAADMLQEAMRGTNISPAYSLMVGDSPLDEKAAHNANVAFALIKGGYTDQPVEEFKADYIIDNLSELIKIFEGKNLAGFEKAR